MHGNKAMTLTHSFGASFIIFMAKNKAAAANLDSRSDNKLCSIIDISRMKRDNVNATRETLPT